MNTSIVYAQIPQGFGVQFKLTTNVIPAGSSLMVDVLLTNQSKGDLPLKMDITGAPDALMRLFDPDGKAVRVRTPSYHWHPLPTPEEEVYRVRPGEQVDFRYDLGDLFVFDVSKPGKYMLQFVTEEGILDKAVFEVVPYRTLDTREVRGAYEPPQYGELMGNAKASVRLSVIESAGAEETLRWLLVSEITSIAEQRTRLPSYPHLLSADASVEKVEMDHRGQVWIVLKSSESHSLLLWRLHELRWDVLIPWTTEDIELGITRARMSISKQNAVIAGVMGKPKFSTHSVWGK